MISTKITPEISTYREKFFLGLSIRQLVCGGAAAALAIVTTTVGSLVLKIDTNLLGYLILFEVMPLCAVGFLQPMGYRFETFAEIYYEWKYKSQRYTVPRQIENRSDSKKGNAQISELPFSISASARRARKKEMRICVRQAKRETVQEKKAALSTVSAQKNK